MKKIGIILLLMMVTLVSCSKDDDENVVNPLIGTWEYNVTYTEENIIIEQVVTFNANNTGLLTVTGTFQGGVPTIETNNFTWKTNGNKLTIIIDNETQVGTYTISGNKLSMTFDGETLIFTRL